MSLWHVIRKLIESRAKTGTKTGLLRTEVKFNEGSYWKTGLVPVKVKADILRFEAIIIRLIDLI